ncbi:MAG: transposase [Acidobacteriota bacterium]|nr:transposase [Acidobacteriota bacterium]
MREKKQRDSGRQFRAADEELDRAASGPRWLSDSRIAENIVQELRTGEHQASRYVLHAFAVMPNHVHVLLTPKADLAGITNQWKGATARHANRILCRVGKPFWQDECFDHWVRNSAQFDRIHTHIEWNPVSARLVRLPEHWPWSSANPRWRQAAAHK